MPSITNFETLLSKLLLRELFHDGSLLLFGFLNILILLLADHLDVARAGLVWVDATMGTVGAATTMLGALNLNVRDAQVVGVEVFEVSVGLCVPEEVKHDLTGLDWPATLGHLELLRLWCAANAAFVL